MVGYNLIENLCLLTNKFNLSIYCKFWYVWMWIYQLVLLFLFSMLVCCNKIFSSIGLIIFLYFLLPPKGLKVTHNFFFSFSILSWILPLRKFNQYLCSLCMHTRPFECFNTGSTSFSFIFLSGLLIYLFNFLS